MEGKRFGAEGAHGQSNPPESDRRLDPEFRREVAAELAEMKRLYLEKTGAKEIPEEGLEALRKQAVAAVEKRRSAAAQTPETRQPKGQLSERAQQALLTRHERELRETAAKAVQGGYLTEEAIPVGATEEETAELLHERELKRAEELRLHGDTDQVAAEFLKSLGVEDAPAKEEPKPRSWLDRLRGK